MAVATKKEELSIFPLTRHFANTMLYDRPFYISFFS